MPRNVEREHPGAAGLLERLAQDSRQAMAGNGDGAMEEAAARFWTLPSDALEGLCEWAVRIAADPAETDERRRDALVFCAAIRAIQDRETSARDALLHVGLAARCWEALR
jgi:hypothetical protein